MNMAATSQELKAIDSILDDVEQKMIELREECFEKLVTAARLAGMDDPKPWASYATTCLFAAMTADVAEKAQDNLAATLMKITEGTE